MDTLRYIIGDIVTRLPPVADRKKGRVAEFAVERTGLEKRVAEAHSYLKGGRKRLVQQIMETPDETVFLSARALGRRFGVDPATIVRTVQALGYDRFADFSGDLRAHFVARITPYKLMEATAREKRSLADHIRASMARDQDNLHALASQMDAERVIHVAKEIHRARRIAVVGIDHAWSLSWFLAYALTILGFDADAPTGTAGYMLHRTRLLGPRDLMIAISFRRCLRETVEAVHRAKRRGVPTVAITDMETTPLALLCDRVLLASIATPAITSSYVAPMALLNAIVIACAHLTPKRALRVLGQTQRDYLTGSRWYREPTRSTQIREANQNE